MGDLEQELKELIISALDLEGVSASEIGSDEILFGEGLGLDSIDGLELGMAIRKKYGITIDAKNEEMRQIFATVNSIARFIERQRGARP
ncbi:MAG TPA: phosphopantetheine-binding protein [Stellaceae bacterium]|nr:phosphopantetheine-binding protein [Stellaceae bacterium]